MVSVKCDLCGSEVHELRYVIDINENNLRFYRYVQNIPEGKQMTGIHHIVQCSNCDLLFTNPRFSTDQLKLVYSSQKIIGGNWKDFRYLFNPELPDELQGLERKTSNDLKLYQWRFDIIDKYCTTSTNQLKLIDIGCGNGQFVNDALNNGFDARGIDLSPDRINEGKVLYGLGDERLRCMNIDDFADDEKFDIVVMWDVIEHVESPSAIFRSLRKISHQHTLVFVLTMSIDSITYKLFKKHWNYINPSQHLHYFSHSTMKKMLEKNNYQLVGIEMDDSRKKNIIHLTARILIGQINQFFFRIYSRDILLRIFFKPFQKGISNERMKKRLENLYPGKYVGRYHDNFVFVARSVD